MDYLNRVEIKGILSFDPTTRVTQQGGEWLTFAVTTKSVAGVNRNRSVYTSTQACIFDPQLVAKVKRLGLHRGSKVWLIGSLFAKKAEKHGFNVAYTTVVVSDIDTIASPKR